MLINHYINAFCKSRSSLGALRDDDGGVGHSCDDGGLICDGCGAPLHGPHPRARPHAPRDQSPNPIPNPRGDDDGAGVCGVCDDDDAHIRTKTLLSPPLHGGSRMNQALRFPLSPHRTLMNSNSINTNIIR